MRVFWNKFVDAYVSELAMQRISEKHQKEVRRVLNRCYEIVGKENPRKVTQDDVYWVLDHYSSRSITTQRYVLCILGKFLRWCGNNVVQDMNIRFPKEEPVRVDWLTREQAVQVLQHAEGELRTLVYLELCLGLRRCEVMRLRVQDIDFEGGVVRVLGKGRMGGKWRTLPLADPTLISVLREAVRNKLPEEQLIKKKRTSLDTMLMIYSMHLGFHFSHHTLRRTFGRTLWEIGVPVETIAKLYGHENTITTLKYIGVNLEHMRLALRKMSDVLRKDENE